MKKILNGLETVDKCTIRSIREIDSRYSKHWNMDRMQQQTQDNEFYYLIFQNYLFKHYLFKKNNTQIKKSPPCYAQHLDTFTDLMLLFLPLPPFKTCPWKVHLTSQTHKNHWIVNQKFHQKGCHCASNLPRISPSLNKKYSWKQDKLTLQVGTYRFSSKYMKEKKKHLHNSLWIALYLS